MIQKTIFCVLTLFQDVHLAVTARILDIQKGRIQQHQKIKLEHLNGPFCVFTLNITMMVSIDTRQHNDKDTSY